MSKKSLLLLPLLSAAPLFLAGAPRRLSADAADSFVADSLTSAAEQDLLAEGAASLFDRALEQLSPQRLQWLQLSLWQRMRNADMAFESQGSLLLGPNHCARLDITIQPGNTPARWLVVSDGRALAHVTQIGKRPPSVTTRLLVPAEPDAVSQKSPAETLSGLGCGGPYVVMKNLRGKLKEPTAQNGVLNGIRVIRIHGRLDPAQVAPQHATAAAAEFCYLYLDAQTLWPGRLEWWEVDRKNAQRLRLELEFRDAVLNRPLSEAECIRAFSYNPEPSD
jgi:hypothetical protein